MTRRFLFVCSSLILCASSLAAGIVRGEEFTSTNYKILDPVINAGGYGSSAGFRLTGTISEAAVGTSTASSFNDYAGFLNFPVVSVPSSVSATAGDGQVVLSWTAATGFLGWTVSVYDIGRSAVSGGPYTYASVGSVTSSAQTGLSNGTTYYFVVVAKDYFGDRIATSSQVSAIPVSSSVGGNTGGGSSGGGSSSGRPTIAVGTTGVVFSGRAYPGSVVTLLKDAQVVTTVPADALANFNISITNLTAGSYIFSVYGEDGQGKRSSPITFPVSLTDGVTTKITGIFIAPTISVDKSEVKRGDPIAILGQSVPGSEVTIQVNSDEPVFSRAKADASGVYLDNFDTSLIDYGDHSVKSRSATSSEISSYSAAVGFKVGDKNIAAVIAAKCVVKGDLNGDCRVNLTDFSIMAYWYKRPSPPLSVDANGDGKVNLIDFSILAFNWTG